MEDPENLWHDGPMTQSGQLGRYRLEGLDIEHYGLKRERGHYGMPSSGYQRTEDE